MSATFQLQSTGRHHQNPSSSVSNSRPLPPSRSNSRNISASDPFLDDNNHHYHNNRLKHKQFSIRPPEPPPKHPYPMAATTSAAPKQQIPRDIDARDTGTVSHPRKFSRSHTAAAPPTRPSQSSRQRSHSQDSVTQAAAAVERAKNKTGRPKKGSQHADVIDRLDFTGVGPMFHHDGPFDACAPSRNRHRTKAPMLAWSSTPNDPIIPTVTQYPQSSPYPTPETYKNTFSDNYYDVPKKKVDVIAEAWGTHEPEPFEDFSAGGGSGRLDGDTPNSSIYNGREGNSRTANAAAAGPKRSKDGRDLRDVYKEYLDGSLQQPTRSTTGTNKRTPLPPPQPIFVPDANHPDLINGPASAPLSSPPLTPKRNKSLMQRIRKMRDAPNVPVQQGGDYETVEPPSPSSLENNSNGYPVAPPVRPTHRPQNSFLGRFGGADRAGGWGGGKGGGNPKENISPTFDSLDRGKDLPATPQPKGYGSATPTPLAEHESRGYFDDDHYETSNGYNTSPGPDGIGRRTTVLRKVKGVVKGAR